MHNPNTMQAITPSLIRITLQHLLGKHALTTPSMEFLYRIWITEIEKKKKKTAPRSHGGILTSKDPNTKETVYAVIFGRRAQMWSFPKGRANFWETSEQTAIREIREETGINMQGKKPIGTTRCGRNPMFLYELPEPIEMHPEDTEEVAEAQWMTLMELQTLKKNRGLKEFVERMLSNKSPHPSEQQHDSREI